MRRPTSVVAALGVLASAGIMVAALSGCGSSGPSRSTDSAFAAREAHEQREAAESTPTSTTMPATTGTMPEIGTYTVIATNTKLIAQVRLGPLRYGQAGAPPAEVLDACQGASNSDSAGNDAFAQGEVLYTYAEGSVPFQVDINGKGNMQGVSPSEDNSASNFVLHTSTGWTCSGQEVTQFTFQPHEKVSVPFWVINSEALTNARPHLSQHELNAVSIDLKPFGAWEHELHASIMVSGSQVVTCPSEEGEQRFGLLPYAQLNHLGSGCHGGGGTFIAGT
jgi:hypothetical protein